MEDPGLSIAGGVTSYDNHSHQQQQQYQHQQLTMHQIPKRQPSPDLIQLSDSDCNLPTQPCHDTGYTIMLSEECDGDNNGFVAEHTEDMTKQQPSTVLSRQPSSVVSDGAEEGDGVVLDGSFHDYATDNSKNSLTGIRGTSCSSDPCLSSPGSVSSPGSDSATPTNLPSGGGDHRTRPSPRHQWHRLVNDEHCQLLGTEEDSSERHSSNDEDEPEDEDQLLAHAQDMCLDPLPSPGGCVEAVASASTLPAAPHHNGISSNSSGGDTDGIWRISEEQRAYYTQQFRRLQPDLCKVLPGQQAKLFFEKSKLSRSVLTRIWNLSDVTQDGALSLPEFLVAMHLVVARRNSVPLPAVLPPPLMLLLLPSLQHQQQQQRDNYARSAGGSSSDASSTAGGGPPCTAAPPAPAALTGEADDVTEQMSPSRAKEWTKFVDSPTSTVSSPGLKPVNFDFQRNAIEMDPKILHPKALHLTPEPERTERETDEGTAAGGSSVSSYSSHPHQPPPPPSSHSSDCYPRRGKGGQGRHTLHRPLPRKPPTVMWKFDECDSFYDDLVLEYVMISVTDNKGGSTPSAATHPSDASQYGPSSLPLGGVCSPVSSGTKRDMHPPPPPPPRPARTHTRSSSLDLNKFYRGCFGAPYFGAPPAVPPRASPATVSPSRKLVYQRSDGDAAAAARLLDDGSAGHHHHHHLTRSTTSDHAAEQHSSAAVTTTSAAAALAQQQQQEHRLLQQQHSASLVPDEQHQQMRRTSAFEVYRKPSTDGSAFERAPELVLQEALVDTAPAPVLVTGARFKDKKEVCASIRTTRDRNTILARLNTELNQELAEVIEERIALEMQLEQMKLFTN